MTLFFINNNNFVHYLFSLSPILINEIKIVLRTVKIRPTFGRNKPTKVIYYFNYFITTKLICMNILKIQ